MKVFFDRKPQNKGRLSSVKVSVGMETMEMTDFVVTVVLAVIVIAVK